MFVHLDINDEENEGILEFFGVTKDQCPTFVIFEIETSSKYLPTPETATDISVSNIGAFLKDYLSGKLTKHQKSQQLPDDWNAGPVTTLVTANFPEIAQDQTKDVFVKFYAPWCGE